MTPQLAQLFGLPVDTGVLIERVGPATPASKAKLRGGTNDVVVAGESYTLGGDLIVAIDDERVASLTELRDVLAHHKPGDTIRLELYRGARQISVPVVLARQPARP